MTVRNSLKGGDTPRRTLRYVAALAATHLLASVILSTMAGDWLATVNLSYLVAAALLVGGMRLRTRSSEVEVEDEVTI